MIEPLKEKAQDVKEKSVAMADTTIKNFASAAWWMFVLAMLFWRHARRRCIGHFPKNPRW